MLSAQVSKQYKEMSTGQSADTAIISYFFVLSKRLGFCFFVERLSW